MVKEEELSRHGDQPIQGHEGAGKASVFGKQ